MFERVIGQKKAKQILSSAVRKDCLSHAYLFTGIHGIGKTTMAKELAMVLNCETKKGCGECSSCRRIKQEIYPDVRIIRPDGPTIKIDDIRSLCDFIAMSSYEGRVKVGIICRAEKMREEAANSLLKTLEEPPKDSLLILTAENQYAVLPTIISRVQKIDCQRLETDEIVDYLQKEGQSPSDALKLAEYSGGSLGKALELRDSQEMQEIFQNVNLVIERLNQLKSHEIIEISAKMGKDRLLAFKFLEILSDVLRTKSFQKDFSTVFGKQYSVTQLALVLEFIEELKLYIEGYGNAQLALESLFIRICRL